MGGKTLFGLMQSNSILQTEADCAWRKTGQESIRNGVYALEGIAKPDDIVVIHDGVRPLVDDAVLTDVLLVAHKYGNAVTSMPYNEQILLSIKTMRRQPTNIFLVKR